jgi:DNA-3-methyladenine glycosylase I
MTKPTPIDIPCGWAPATDAFYRQYHDTEWGVPERDPRALWEKFQLDGCQAGLSWITILRKRADMRVEFDGFDPEKLAQWSETRIAQALQNPGVIRSPAKIAAMVSNARIYLDMQAKGEDFADWLWDYVDGKPIITRLDHWKNVAASTPLSETIAKDMKRRGFKFCGPTIVYAVMQAVGVVNDHEVRCPRHTEVQGL